MWGNQHRAPSQASKNSCSIRKTQHPPGALTPVSLTDPGAGLVLTDKPCAALTTLQAWSQKLELQWQTNDAHLRVAFQAYI